MTTRTIPELSMRAGKTDIVQVTAQRLIEEEVLICQTQLIDALLEQEALGCFTIDDMHHAWCQVTPGDCEVQRVREWWMVTPNLGAKLKQIGQTVLHNDYGQWWGRTIVGQPIVMDGTMQHVARLILSRDTPADPIPAKSTNVF